ncbi:MAG TPA: DUF5317 family protein [Chloroflexota bacterium]|nr:DUF5317 family protein [Chloroflexota bacterium]
MTALVALGLIGVAVALLRGGSFAGWARIHVRWPALALGSLGVQLLLHNSPTDHQAWAIAWGPIIWTACLAILCAVLLRNALATRATRYPWLLAAVGVGLNLLVVVANGGFMPQSADARMAARGAPIATDQSSGPQLRNIVVMNDATRLSLIGDVIAEPAWFPNANVLSLGDLLLGLGLAWWAFGITLSAPRRAARPWSSSPSLRFEEPVRLAD